MRVAVWMVHWMAEVRHLNQLGIMTPTTLLFGVAVQSVGIFAAAVAA